MRRLIFALILPVALAACEEKHDQGWLGYGEGDSAMISAPQAGWVTELKVERGTVRANAATCCSCWIPPPRRQAANRPAMR